MTVHHNSLSVGKGHFWLGLVNENPCGIKYGTYNLELCIVYVVM